MTDEGLGIAEPRPIRRWLIRFGIALTLLSILYVGGAAIAVQGLPEKVARLQVIWENARFGERAPVRGPGREGNVAAAHEAAWQAVFVDTKDAAGRERLPAIVADLVRRGAETAAFDFRAIDRFLPPTCFQQLGLAEELRRGPSDPGLESVFDVLWHLSDLVRIGAAWGASSANSNAPCSLEDFLHQPDDVWWHQTLLAWVAEFAAASAELRMLAERRLAHLDETFPDSSCTIAKATLWLVECLDREPTELTATWPRSVAAASSRAYRAARWPLRNVITSMIVDERVALIETLDGPWRDVRVLLDRLESPTRLAFVLGDDDGGRVAETIRQHHATHARIRMLRVACGSDPATIADPFGSVDAPFDVRVEGERILIRSRGPDGEFAAAPAFPPPDSRFGFQPLPDDLLLLMPRPESAVSTSGKAPR